MKALGIGCWLIFRSQIKYSPESIQRAVVQMVPRTILRSPNGNRNVLYFYRNDDGKWNWNYNWLNNDWSADNPSACLATSFVSPLAIYLLGEFCFESWPFQPPSIFPISAISWERAIYFLLSRDLVSQRIRKNIFTVSVFLIANLT